MCKNENDYWMVLMDNSPVEATQDVISMRKEKFEAMNQALANLELPYEAFSELESKVNSAIGASDLGCFINGFKTAVLLFGIPNEGKGRLG